VKVFNTVREIKEYLAPLKQSIGFVPTMGALHDGHMSLIKRAKSENELCVCSIFVNPTQFDNSSDLDKYPRTLENDCQLLENNDCDVVFAPTVEEIYPSLPSMTFDFGPIEKVMEGEHRTGHFNGVGIVVSKLLHIIQPQNAYFGLKDLQQVAIINLLVKDLSFPVNIIPCETVREPSGLARSSRNERLSAEGRLKASLIQESIQFAKNQLLNGKSILETKTSVAELYALHQEFEVEYFEISDFETLQPIVKYKKEIPTAICTAVFFEGVRLIDNIVI
jgi:pantoate--beta-alanine ligase